MVSADIAFVASHGIVVPTRAVMVAAANPVSRPRICPRAEIPPTATWETSGSTAPPRKVLLPLAASICSAPAPAACATTAPARDCRGSRRGRTDGTAQRFVRRGRQNQISSMYRQARSPYMSRSTNTHTGQRHPCPHPRPDRCHPPDPAPPIEIPLVPPGASTDEPCVRASNQRPERL